jgi:hypothetical protein
MRDGGELPIHRVLRPNHREEDHATHNLAEKEKRHEECGIKGRHEGKRKRNSGKYRVSDSREEGE